jgi:hypothetical protein
MLLRKLAAPKPTPTVDSKSWGESWNRKELDSKVLGSPV